MNENILHLENPEGWSCELWEISNNDMIVRLYKPFQTGSMWVKFHNVQYFECPRSWISALITIVKEEVIIENEGEFHLSKLHNPEKFKIYSIDAQLKTSQSFNIYFIAEEVTLRK